MDELRNLPVFYEIYRYLLYLKTIFFKCISIKYIVYYIYDGYEKIAEIWLLTNLNDKYPCR